MEGEITAIGWGDTSGSEEEQQVHGESTFFAGAGFMEAEASHGCGVATETVSVEPTQVEGHEKW